MRVLVLGATGMLGHKMVERLRQNFSSVIGVSRPSFDATNFASVDSVVSFFKPDIVVNCVGVIKQREQDPVLLEKVNRELPHFLQRISPYLIHFSTDCVFSGNKGRYSETDWPDPLDLYGATKWAGEVVADNALVLRTSIVGREMANHRGLLEWFLHQKGKIYGYENAFFTGVTTNWLADTVGELLKREQRLSGLYNIASYKTSKCQLLKWFQQTYNKYDVEIVGKSTTTCDRSLDSTKFQQATGILKPNLEEMLFWMKKTDDERINPYVI